MFLPKILWQMLLPHYLWNFQNIYCGRCYACKWWQMLLPTLSKVADVNAIFIVHGKSCETISMVDVITICGRWYGHLMNAD